MADFDWFIGARIDEVDEVEEEEEEEETEEEKTKWIKEEEEWK